jgi:DeoR/GlpR family transcriptional regulator of sugar metabolism
MVPYRRHELIVSAARELKFVPIDELVKLTGTSRTTIRRDIADLSGQGKIEKVHGGISFSGENGSSANSYYYRNREKVFQSEKTAIGKAAQRYIHDGDVIVLINGTTTTQVARHIQASKHVSVITNGIDIVNELRVKPNVEVILLGGIVNYAHDVIVGPTVVKMLEQFNPSKMVTGAGGITEEKGLTIYNFIGASNFHEIVERVGEIIVVADRSKFGRNVLVQGAPLDKIGAVVTDRGVPRDYVQMLKRHDIECTLA